MLDSPLPITFVKAAIVPIHLAISMPHVIEVVALVRVTTCPSKNTVTAFFVVGIFTLVFVGFARSTLPNSIAVP
jgi:hypothetical protein